MIFITWLNQSGIALFPLSPFPFESVALREKNCFWLKKHRVSPKSTFRTNTPNFFCFLPGKRAFRKHSFPGISTVRSLSELVLTVKISMWRAAVSLGRVPPRFLLLWLDQNRLCTHWPLRSLRWTQTLTELVYLINSSPLTTARSVEALKVSAGCTSPQRLASAFPIISGQSRATSDRIK